MTVEPGDAADTPTAVADHTDRDEMRALVGQMLLVLFGAVLALQAYVGWHVAVPAQAASNGHTESQLDLVAQNDSVGADALAADGVFTGALWATFKEAHADYETELADSTRSHVVDDIREGVWMPGIRQFFEWSATRSSGAPSDDALARGEVYLYAQTVCGTLEDDEDWRSLVLHVLNGRAGGNAEPMVDRILEFAENADNCDAIQENRLH